MKYRRGTARLVVNGRNPLKLDPTRLTTVRRGINVSLKKAFRGLVADLNNLILRDDAFGFHGVQLVPYVANAKWDLASLPDKVKHFTDWFAQQIKSTVLGRTVEDLVRSVVETGYRRGVVRGWTDTKGVASPNDMIKLGVKDQFVSDLYRTTGAGDMVKLITQSSLTNLTNATEDMKAKAATVLSNGLMKGTGAQALAKELAETVKVSAVRAMMIVQTELTKAHAEGQLAAMAAVGIKSVKGVAEWVTAGDDKVCPTCSSLEGKQYTLAEAVGKIPQHPNCRCAWAPVKAQAPTANALVLLPRDAAGDLALVSRFLVNYDPTQPRNPAGSPTGGQFASKGVHGGANVPHPSKVTLLKTLSGSSAPKLVEDEHGGKWVMKTGTTPRLKNEALADKLYSVVGARTAYSGVTEAGDYKMNHFLEGAQTLGDWKQGKTKEQIDAIHKEIGKHFVADALLANWDVVGAANDNIMVKGDKVYRIDNGGALKYRAMGALKGAAFGETVTELSTLRDPSKNPNTAKVFAHLTDADIHAQSKELLTKRNAVLDATDDAETKAILDKRFDYLQKQVDQYEAKQSALPQLPPPPPPSPVAHPVVEPHAAKAGALPDHMTDPGKLTDYITKNKGDATFSPLYLDKLKVMNPEGVKNGVFFIPNFPTGEKSSLSKVAQLEKILPPGTIIKKKSITAKDIAAKAGNLSPEIKAKPVDPTPTPAPAVAPPAAKPTTPSDSEYAEDLKKALTEIGLNPSGVGKNKVAIMLGISKSEAKTVLDQLHAEKWVNPNLAKTKPTITPITKTTKVETGKSAPITVTGTAAEKAAAWNSVHPVPPAPDYNKYLPAVTDEATVDLPSYKDMKVSFGEDHETWAKTLPAEEAAAIASWKGAAQGIRKAISTNEVDQKSANFMSAVSKSKPHAGVLYRGVHENGGFIKKLVENLTAAGVGGEYVDNAPHCTTPNPEVATKFSYGDLFFRIKARTARPIQKSDGFHATSTLSEMEVVGMPNTRYRINGIYSNVNVNGKTVKHFVDLEEIV